MSGYMNKDLTLSARMMAFWHKIDLDAANLQQGAFLDTMNDARIYRIEFIYSVPTDTGTVPEAIQVGTAADPDLYFTGLPTISQALGTIELKTVLNSEILLPAYTPLIINKDAATGGTNTGEVTVIVRYEPVDVT